MRLNSIKKKLQLTCHNLPVIIEARRRGGEEDGGYLG